MRTWIPCAGAAVLVAAAFAALLVTLLVVSDDGGGVRLSPARRLSGSSRETTQGIATPRGAVRRSPRLYALDARPEVRGAMVLLRDDMHGQGDEHERTNHSAPSIGAINVLSMPVDAFVFDASQPCTGPMVQLRYQGTTLYGQPQAPYVRWDLSAPPLAYQLVPPVFGSAHDDAVLLEDEELLEAARVGALRWNAALGVPLLGAPTMGSVFDGMELTGRNQIGFGTLRLRDEDGGDDGVRGIVAVTSVWWRCANGASFAGDVCSDGATPQFLEFKVLFNSGWHRFADVTKADAPVAVWDFFEILMHELGHVVGLHDEYEAPCAPTVMNGHATRGETRKRTLTDIDQYGVRALYADVVRPVRLSDARATATYSACLVMAALLFAQ